MIQVIIYGLIGGLSLTIGAITGIVAKFKERTIAAFMAFGSGVLICALSIGLMRQAFSHGGFDAVIIGFLGGAVIYILGDSLLHKYIGRKHKYNQKNASTNSNGQAIVLGAILDGIPESIALGISIFSGSGVGILVLAAIILSNFPESISSLVGLKKEKFSNGKIITLWLILGLIFAAITFLSFIFLRILDLNTVGMLESFAAGAILAMLADTMMPEAYEEGGLSIGFATVLGFLVAFIISFI
ncbi:MAG: ZIP family zinc transporter [Patescibacteria group bacterium]|nr:ZIP family zinc transporter [Patescibacteria group bacterium]